jgi:hypothetical protein
MRTPGLLKKAELLRDVDRGHLRLLGPDELRVEQEDEITPEERRKVLAQIEEVVAGSRLKVTPKTFSFRPLKNGGILPIMVNLVALVVIAAGVTLAVVLSRRSEQAIIAAPVTILTAEGKMLEVLKEQSRQQLAGKDQEIASIREKLSGMDGERARIRQEADASVKQKEADLQAAFAKSLDDERRKMEANGVSAQDVNARIAALQAKQATQQDAQLAAFRSQVDADRAAKEKTIADLQAGYQSQLTQAQAERAQVQADAARRQSELEAGYKQKQLALEKDSAAAVSALNTLRQQRANEQLVLDQLLSWYQKARDQIQGGKPDAARSVLAGFRKFLDDPALAALPAVVQRRPVDLFLIDSLDQIAQSQAAQSSNADATASLVASANLITTVAGLVQQGEDAFKVQGYAKARELYVAALAKIPAVRTGYDRLAEIEKIFSDRQQKDLAAQFAAGNAAYRAADYAKAAAIYGQALAALQNDPQGAAQLVAQLGDIGAQRQAAEDAARILSAEGDAASRARNIAAVESLSAALASSHAAAGTSEEPRTTLVALLGTKLLVQQTLLRPEVARDHPELFDQLNAYLEALAAESRTNARKEALQDLDALLGSIGAGGPSGSGSSAVPGFISSPGPSVAARFASADEQELLLSILSRLHAMLK